MTILFWDEFWPQGWPFILFKHIQLGNPDTQKDYPSKGEGTTAIWESKLEEKKGVGWEGKMFHDFLVTVSRV